MAGKRQLGFRVWGAYYGTGWTLLTEQVFHGEEFARECYQAVTADTHSQMVLPSDKRKKPNGEVIDDPNPGYIKRPHQETEREAFLAACRRLQVQDSDLAEVFWDEPDHVPKAPPEYAGRNAVYVRSSNITGQGVVFCFDDEGRLTLIDLYKDS